MRYRGKPRMLAQARPRGSGYNAGPFTRLFAMPIPRLALLACALLLCACGEVPAGVQSATERPRQLGMCATCHGEDGRSRIAGTPHLNGQDEAYLVDSMLQYRDGRRSHAAMRAVVGALSEADIRGFAAWYARQSPCPPEQAP
jgi:cytochrome c553